MAIVNAARLAAALLIAAALSALAGCGQGQQKQAGPPPPPAVTVANPEQRTVVDQDEYVGRFVAVDAVEVRARLSGYLSEIHFTDGQMVKKGDLLFTIDRRPFSIALEQMRANLAQARANLAFTEADLARGQELVHNKTITEQSYDQRIQAKRVAEASVAAQEAMVHSAELDFNEYSQLRAPIDGRIGDRRVSVGNLVSGSIASNTTLLATIVSVDPIRFEFTFDEASYLRYQRFAGPATQMAKGEGGVSVSLKLHRRAGVRTHREDGFRRQCHRSLLGHDPRPRGIRQSRRQVHARNVRTHPRSRLAAAFGAAHSRCRDRYRADRASSCSWSMTAGSPGRNTSRSASLTAGCA